MRDWLIEEQEVVGLTQGSNEGYALLLAIRHSIDASMKFIADPQLFKPCFNLLKRAVVGDAIFNLHILQRSKLSKETQVLKENAYVVLTNVTPLIDIVGPNILVIK
jgi:hypothetical protein